MPTKILPFVLFAIATSISAQAQIKKGATLLGGQLSFLSASDKIESANNPQENKSSNFSITPAFGKAVKDNLIIGADLTYGHSKNYIAQNSDSYGLGFFIRQYKDLGKGFFLFGQGRVGGAYNHQKTDLGAGNSSQIGKGFTAELAFYPGAAYAVTSKFQLEIGFTNLAFIRYTHNRTETSPASVVETSNNFTLGSSLSSFAGVSVGFRYLVNK